MNKSTSYFLKFDQKNVSNLAAYIIKVMWFNKFDQIWFYFLLSDKDLSDFVECKIFC